MKRINKTILLLLLTMMVISIFPTQVHADMGPKPSIKLTVVNAPEDYYIALLADEFERDMPESELQIDSVTEDSVREYLKNFYYNGWYFFESPVGRNVYKKNVEGVYLFDYMVPNPFRVIIISTDGTITISKEIHIEEYNSEVTYDFSADTLTEKNKGKGYGKRIFWIIVCYILTLIFEYIILKIFRYPKNKRNLICFFVTNTITQIALNTFVAVFWNAGLAMFIVSIWIEIFIIAIEAIVYAFNLVDMYDDRHPARGIAYSIAANLFSIFMGVVLLYLGIWIGSFFR
ncbi:MAG: hypothetical protein J6O17_08400 [Eubacterium sp.]|nr:hypothetical protein [Eubacterium sp.]